LYPVVWRVLGAGPLWSTSIVLDGFALVEAVGGTGVEFDLTHPNGDTLMHIDTFSEYMDIDPRNTERMLDELLDSGVLIAERDSEHFRLGERFTSEFYQNRQDLSDDEVFEEAASSYIDETRLEPRTVTRPLIASSMALDTLGVELPAVEQLMVAILLDQFTESHPTGGIPNGFTPVSGRNIEPFTSLLPAAVIYCWREDCPPCDTVRDNFETLLEKDAIPNHVGLGAVYGPDFAELLLEDFEVSGAPTVLFFKDGRVDSRYVGPRSVDQLQVEITTIAESVSAGTVD
jgi:thiol-disulfide isomerase/thioredoxin